MNLCKVKSSLGALSVALALASGPAAAGVTFFPPVTGFEDNDLEFHIDTDGDSLLSVGDRLRGIFEIDQTFGVFGGGPASILPHELTGIFDLTVGAKIATATPGLFNFAFAPTFGATAANLFLDATPDLVIVPPNCASIAACEGLATDGVLWASVGFADPDDQWLALNAADNIGAVAGGGASSVFGTVNFALSVLVNNTGMNILPQNLDCFPLGPFTCAGDGITQVIGSGNILGGSGLSNGYQIRSDFDYQLRAPEPGSLALLAIALLGLGGALRRRSA
jgi:hypothetical protein